MILKPKFKLKLKKINMRLHKTSFPSASADGNPGMTIADGTHHLPLHKFLPLLQIH
jgi:hypothetical protein